MAHLKAMFQGFLTIQNDDSGKSKAKSSLEILPNFSYLISQIFACFNEVHLKEPDLNWILQSLNSMVTD